MFEGELRVASVVRASEPCKSEGKAPTSEGEEPASAGASASPGKGTELGALGNTSGSTSSSKKVSSASSYQELEY